MLKIAKRGEVWHYSGTVAGRRLRGSTGAADKATAQRIAAEIEARQWQSHLDGPGASVTFAQAAIAYRQAEKPMRFLAKIEDHWRDTLLRDITAGAIKQSAIKLYPRAKGATRNRQVIVPTQAIINHAAGLFGSAKVSVARFAVDGKVKVPATAAWAEAFAAASSPHLGALCLFMFGTGARIGEAVALTWGAVDLPARRALVNQSKTGSERLAHLPARVVAALANIPSNRASGDPVFGYADAQNVKQVWDKAVDRAKIERLTPHSCRHGFATAMLRAGYDVKTVAKLGGWKDAGTVLKYYAHAMDDLTLTDALFTEIGTELTQGESDPVASIGNVKTIR